MMAPLDQVAVALYWKTDPVDTISGPAIARAIAGAVAVEEGPALGAAGALSCPPHAVVRVITNGQENRRVTHLLHLRAEQSVSRNSL
jgi:hypothetical protein